MIKRYDTMLSSERSPMEVLYEQQDISAEYEGILNKVADADEGKTFLSVASRDWKDKYNRLGKRGSLPYKDALGSGMRQYWELANCWKETDHSFAEEFDKEYRMHLHAVTYNP
ncbi:MAG: hypothetical protein K6E91_14610 [Butyrivibrio sp.]|nr:hypothetical protein [Butyrivibrio sp.]